MFGDGERVDPVAAVTALRAGLDAVMAADWHDLDAEAAPAVIAELEIEARRLGAAASDLMAAVDLGGWHRRDGHGSAKVMVRHVAQLSAAEATAREGVAKVMAELPDVAAAYRAGRVGTPQLRRLGRVWRNPRVRDLMAACDFTFLRAAQEMEYPDFDKMLGEWERLVDQDGPRPGHDRRHVRLWQDPDLNWHLRAVLGSVEGAQVNEILEHFEAAERLADLETAKAEHGEQFRDHLPRTSAQQRADGLTTIFRLAAGAPPGTSQAAVTTDIMIDQVTYERVLAWLVGADTDPIDPLDGRYRCSTRDGTPVDPYEAVARGLVGHVRRVVYDSAGTVIDKGRRVRLFTGSAREAAQLRDVRCVWPGCWTRVDACQIDHLQPTSTGGRTDPGNGAPMCGRHNRLKHRADFHVWHDPADGLWHMQRPDGTEVPSHLVYDPWAIHDP